mmetsp:Transcript_20300/g.77715  ORF Transcript_20300/g.77715 Transcript_20300/m.77715 type:complete len:294 (+) Transcript_20300:1095-1976(+)
MAWPLALVLAAQQRLLAELRAHQAFSRLCYPARRPHGLLMATTACLAYQHGTCGCSRALLLEVTGVRPLVAAGGDLGTLEGTRRQRCSTGDRRIGCGLATGADLLFEGSLQAGRTPAAVAGARAAVALAGEQLLARVLALVGSLALVGKRATTPRAAVAAAREQVVAHSLAFEAWHRHRTLRVLRFQEHIAPDERALHCLLHRPARASARDQLGALSTPAGMARLCAHMPALQTLAALAPARGEWIQTAGALHCSELLQRKRAARAARGGDSGRAGQASAGVAHLLAHVVSTC